MNQPTEDYGDVQVDDKLSDESSTEEAKDAKSDSVTNDEEQEVEEFSSDSPSQVKKTPCKSSRRSYTREEKLQVIEFYYHCGGNKYQTGKRFSVNHRTLTRWIKEEGKIRRQRRGKKADRGRKPALPELEEQLFDDYVALKGRGFSVSQKWFQERARVLYEHLHPDKSFKFSKGWVEAFKRRHAIVPANTREHPLGGLTIQPFTPEDFVSAFDKQNHLCPVTRLEKVITKLKAKKVSIDDFQTFANDALSRRIAYFSHLQN